MGASIGAIATRRILGQMVGLADALLVTGVLGRALAGDLTAVGAGGNDPLVFTCAESVAGVLMAAIRFGVAAGMTFGKIVYHAIAGAVTNVLGRALAWAVAAQLAGWSKAIVDAEAGSVAAILHQTLSARIAAGRALGPVIGQAGSGPVTAVLGRALGGRLAA